VWELKWAWQIFFYSSHKTVGATVLGGLWALEWAWQISETNLRCAGMSGIYMPNPIIVALSCRDLSVHSDRRTWLDRLG